MRTGGGGSTSIWEVYVNSGSSWNAPVKWWNNAPVDARLDYPNVRLVDVNGDNLPDIVKTSANGMLATWEVYKNSGFHWTPAIEHWLHNASVDAHLAKGNVTLTDINADGLADIVRGTDNFGIADTWEVLLNKGNRWETTWQTWIAPASNVELDLR